jgi:hypothetical protein
MNRADKYRGGANAHRMAPARPYDSLPRKIIAWHCGGKPRGEPFSSFKRHVGTGEGMGILGPGLYFINSEEAALGYCRYAKKPVLYSVEIDTDGFYDSVWGYDTIHGSPSLLGKILDAEAERLQERAAGVDVYRHGRNQIGVIYRALGQSAAIERLVQLGVRGAFEHLPDGSFELAVFDPSAISPISEEDL